MQRLKRIFDALRPGLRGKLSLVLAAMLAAMIGVLLAIALKQQQVTLSAAAENEIVRFLEPVESLSREIVFHTANIKSVEGLRFQVQRRKGRKDPNVPYDFDDYFTEDQVDRAEALLRSRIRENPGDPGVDEDEYRPLGRLGRWLALYEGRTRASRVNRQALEKILRKELDTTSRARTALTGLDLTRYRIQSIDLWRWSGFDSRRMLRGAAKLAPINTLDMGSTKQFRAELDRLEKAYAEDERPLPEPARLEYSNPDAGYLLITRMIFGRADTSARARLVLEALEKSNHWNNYARAEAALNVRLSNLAREIKKRREELKQDEKHPRRDPDLHNLIKAYKAGVAERHALTDEYARETFLRLDPSFAALEENLARLEAELETVDRKTETERYQALFAEIRELRERRESSTLSASRATADAFRHLRDAAFYERAVMAYDFDPASHQEYLRSNWKRGDQTKRWAGLRDWTCAYYNEIYLPAQTAGAGLLVLTRTQAEEAMWEIDVLPLERLAYRLLYENTAGYIRILMDQSEQVQSLRKERDRLLDTALSIGLRIFFLAFFLSGILVAAIKEIIARAHRVGAGDLTVQFGYQGRDELGDLTASLNKMVVDLRNREELRGELSAAEEIQKQLLPDAMPANMKGHLNIAAFYRAMSGIGGDYYDFIEAGEDRTVFCVADVSSHGAGPAIIMTLMRAQLRAIVRRGQTEPRPILMELNDAIYADTPPSIFITVFLAVYDKKTHEITFCSAGHNDMLLYRHASKSVKTANPDGMPLGALDSELFGPTLETGKTALKPGDLLLQYTDGITEAMNADREMYGMGRLTEQVQAHATAGPHELLRKIAQDVATFSGKQVFGDGPSDLNDDIAMIALRRKPKQAAEDSILVG